LTRLERSVGDMGGRTCFVCVDFDKRVQFFIIAVNPFEITLDQRTRAQCSVA